MQSFAAVHILYSMQQNMCFRLYSTQLSRTCRIYSTPGVDRKRDMCYYGVADPLLFSRWIIPGLTQIHIKYVTKQTTAPDDSLIKLDAPQKLERLSPHSLLKIQFLQVLHLQIC